MAKKGKKGWIVRTTSTLGIGSEHVVTEPEPSLAMDNALAEADGDGVELSDIQTITMTRVLIIR